MVGRTAVKDEGHAADAFVDMTVPAGDELSIALLLPAPPTRQEVYAATVGSKILTLNSRKVLLDREQRQQALNRRT
jgi:hypothetical protein